MKTVVGLFDNFAHAQHAVQRLENLGLSRHNISVIVNNASGQYGQADTTTTTTETPAEVGAETAKGAVAGGVTGLLIGLVPFVIPGLGAIAAIGWLTMTLVGVGVGAAVGLVGALTGAGVPHEHAVYYSEGVRRGGTLLAVKAEDAMADRVARILSEEGAVDIEERAAAWRQEGFTPTPATAPAAAAATTVAAATAAAENAVQTVRNEPPVPESPVTTTPPVTTPVPQHLSVKMDEVTLSVMEEELQVGKRQVQRGGVHVYTHMTETPVEENVQLREEHVTVERHLVNRPIDEKEWAAFKESAIEVTEMAEEPVITKRARIVEEVTVGKEATEHTETIHDTVRHTDVEVAPFGDQHVSRTASYDTYATDFRDNFNTTYSSRGMAYERYEPAYRYGYDLASDRRYSGRDWAAIEPDIQRAWEARNPGTWANFKDAVRYSWGKAVGAERGGIQTGGRAVVGTPDTRGISEKIADALTGDRIDDKTGKPVA